MNEQNQEKETANVYKTSKTTLTKHKKLNKTS